jgi:hypothetical protein
MTIWYQRSWRDAGKGDTHVEWTHEAPLYWEQNRYRLLSKMEYHRMPTQGDFVDLMPGSQLAFQPKD